MNEMNKTNKIHNQISARAERQRQPGKKRNFAFLLNKTINRPKGQKRRK
jgi:hypothetical protein